MAGISVAYDLAKEVGVKNILESFFYIKNKKEMVKEMIKNHDFILDSGAFSAMTQKKYINIKFRSLKIRLFCTAIIRNLILIFLKKFLICK